MGSNVSTAQPRIDEATLLAVQQQMAQQAAFSQVPDVVKRVSARPTLASLAETDVVKFIVHFHKAVLDNNLAEITVAYESGWNRLTEKFYSKTEWPEAEVIAPLVNDGKTAAISWRLALQLHQRPDLLDLVSRALLSPCVLKTAARHRRSLPLLRKQLRAVQLPAK